jgi:hypothetical protein
VRAGYVQLRIDVSQCFAERGPACPYVLEAILPPSKAADATLQAGVKRLADLLGNDLAKRHLRAILVPALACPFS